MSAEPYRRCADCRWHVVHDFPVCRLIDSSGWITLGQARTLCRGERWEAPPASIA